MAPRGRPDEDDDDDAEDIGEYVVEGKALRKVIQRGRRRTLPFAFCPVSGDEVTWFATHRKKPASRIARKTRRESGQFKVAFGTFVVQGKLIVLTCIDTIPTLARRLKRHLAREGIRMNVRALDAEGVEIEADIEEIDDDGLGEDDGDDGDDAPSPGASRPKAAEPPPSRADTFAARLSAAQGPVLAARGEKGEHLRHLLAGIFDAQDQGDGKTAETLLDRLEDEVRKLMNSGARPVVAAPRPAPSAPERPAPERPAPDRRAQVALARRAADLRDRIGGLDADAQGRLMAALKIGARQIHAGDLIAAADTVERVARAVERVEARRAEGAA